MRFVAGRFVSSVALLSLLAAPAGFAQAPASTATTVPRVIGVTGTVRLAAGALGPVEIVTFAIYADETGGEPLWQETQNVTFNSEGQYSALLGSTVADGMPLDVFLSKDARWLGVRVQRGDGKEQPRILIVSVPYALRASDADTLGGKPASAYALTGLPPDAAAPIGTSAATKTAATQSSTSAAASSFATAGWIPLATDNVGDLGNSMLFQNGSSLGVGTTTPFDALHVRFANTTGTMAGLALQNLGNTATSYSGMLFYDQNSAVVNFQGFNNFTHEYRINNIAPGGSINFMLGSSSKFLVATSGNVGIGTTTPGSKLDVFGDINVGGSALRLGGSTILQAPGFQHNNLGIGFDSLNFFVTGTENTGVGNSALQSITGGTSNTALGFEALKSMDNGLENIAVGTRALFQDSTGSFNVAVGYSPLLSNVSSNANVGIGFAALGALTAGVGSNTAVGFQALSQLGTGDVNLALGAAAGSNLVGANSNNVDIANFGVAGDSGVVRIGATGTHSSFFAAGIRGVTTGTADAVSVVIDSNGQLGTINSSRRYKQDIQDMGDASSGLMKLRPVTYRYKQAYADGTTPIDYGLIAEEVEQVYPDLVAHLADGEVETVQYQKINAMLLNEVQKQHAELEQQRALLAALKARLDVLERERR